MDLFTGPKGIYRPLQGSEIRLIKLKRTRSSDQPIEVELFYASLDTAKFFALSYQWGEPGETNNIVADLLDTAPAEAQARQDTADTDTDTDTDENLMGWWIDAICINQASFTERSKEVPRMGKIYSTAARVIIWPGDSDAFKHDHLNAAIADAAKRHARNLRELKPPVSVPTNDVAAQNDLYIQSILKHDLDKPFLMKAISALYHDLRICHFSRVWTFQEVVMARSSPIVLLGIHSTSLMFLEWIRGGLATLTRISPYKDSISMLDRSTLQGGLMSLTILEGRQMCEAQSSGDGARDFASQLCAILRLSSGNRTARDPRDRIFGMLGMTNLPTPTPLDIQPDYKRSFADVAFGYAKFLVCNHDRLDLLAMGVNSLSGYPSWVPDFDIPIVFRPEPGEVRSVASLSASGRCLVARGSLIGSVAAVVPFASETFLPDFEGKRDPQSQDAMDAAFSAWSDFLDQIVRPSANLRSVSRELVVREWLELPRAEGYIDDDGCTVVATLGLTEAAGHACGGALYDALRGLLIFFMAIRYVLLDDGHVLRSVKRGRQDPKPGDVVSAIRGMDVYAVLRRLGVDRAPEGFQIIDARCLGIGSLPSLVTEDVFTNRAERDFNIW